MTSTEELGHQITRCIADAVSDVLAHVASYTSEQVAAGRGRCPDCNMPAGMHCDPGCPQPCRACAASDARRAASEPEPEHDIRWLTGRINQLENALGEAIGRFAFPPDVTLEARARVGVQQLGYWKMILRGEPAAATTPASEPEQPTIVETASPVDPGTPHAVLEVTGELTPELAAWLKASVRVKVLQPDDPTPEAARKEVSCTSASLGRRDTGSVAAVRQVRAHVGFSWPGAGL